AFHSSLHHGAPHSTLSSSRLFPPPPQQSLFKVPKKRASYKHREDTFAFLDKFQSTIDEANPRIVPDFKKLGGLCVDPGTAARTANSTSMEELARRILATTLRVEMDEVEDQVFFTLSTS
ncbi:UNVERIFIED_CONTAM: hypothetical protein HDU68_005982, partial [Siphonaria sp. JEL0065]